MAALLHRLLPLLFLLSWPFFLRDGNRSQRRHADDLQLQLHPIVLLPGHSCSQLRAQLTDEYEPPAAAPRCGARKGKGWFRLWENYTALQDPALLPCYAEQTRLVYDTAARDFRNVKGVHVQVVSFGTLRGFGSNNPSTKNNCMERLVEELEGVGYREGENLFGAPYDFRYAPAPPGQPALHFSYFVSSLRLLIERASERNGNRPVIVVTHSHGGLNAVEFFNENTVAWRKRYVKHFVMVSTGAGGTVTTLGSAAAGTGNTTSSIGGRSFASAFLLIPSPKVFGHTPLVITPAKNYSAYDIPEFLAAVGFSDDEVARYRTRSLPVTMGFRAPIVPTTCINGAGVATVEKLVYPDGNLHGEPRVVYGEGDGLLNMASLLALDTVIGDDPAQDFYRSVLIPNATHNGILKDDFALNRVVAEILEANKVV